MVWLDAAPLWLIWLVLTIALVVAEELGVRLRRFTSARKGEALPEKSEPDEGVGNLVGSALGLLALILGFTYAMSQDRYDQRRGLVMEEARAVAASYLRFQAFDEPERSVLSGLMKDYAALRSQAFDAQRDRIALKVMIQRTDALQSQIWADTLDGLRRRPDLIEPVMESVNDMFGAAATRRVAVDARIPMPIQLALAAFAVMSAFFTGYGLTLERRHRLAIVALFTLFTFVLVLVLDLDRSQSGTIRVSQAPMVQAAERIAASEAAKVRPPHQALGSVP